MRQSRVPAVFMRGGTSNAVVFDRAHLPDDEAVRERLFIAALGSPDPYGRQLDGMGGGISSLSKVCIVGPPSRPDADVDYTFGQVAVDRPQIDWSSNCGNMSSAIGPFAVDEGMVDAPGPEGVVVIHNTNTGKLIRSRFPVEDGRAAVDGETAIPGVPGTGAPVDLEFLDPGGAGTGTLLPTGNVFDHLEVEGAGTVRASLVDAANAFVFVDATDVGIDGTEMPADLDARPEVMERLERVRAAAAVAMGIAADPAEASSRFPSAPKIGVVAPPRPATTLRGESVETAEGDLTARMVSMNNVHRALPLTGVLGFAVAAAIEGTVVARALRSRGGGDSERIRLISPSGVITAAAAVRRAGGAAGMPIMRACAGPNAGCSTVSCTCRPAGCRSSPASACGRPPEPMRPLTSTLAGAFALAAVVLAAIAVPARAQTAPTAEFPKTDFENRIVDLSEFMSGGPPRDGIPAVDEPRHASTDDAAEWLDPDEPVIAVEIAGEARAYPLQVLIWHEIANDSLGGTPIAVTFCPLCNSAIVFDRRLDGEILDFGTTGRLRLSDLVMYDRQTETWWQQLTGTGLVGEHAGRELVRLPAAIVSWRDFRTAFPGATVLSRETGYSRRYGSNPYAGYDSATQPFLLQGTPDPCLPAMERVLHVAAGGSQRIYPFGAFADEPVINDEVGGEPVVVMSRRGTLSALDSPRIEDSRRIPSAAAYARRLEGRTLDFELRDGRIADTATSSVWNLFGEAVEGPLTGSRLAPLSRGEHFAFAWLAFHPDADVYGVTAPR